jgi:hypothetical protein
MATFIWILHSRIMVVSGMCKELATERIFHSYRVNSSATVLIWPLPPTWLTTEQFLDLCSGGNRFEYDNRLWWLSFSWFSPFSRDVIFLYNLCSWNNIARENKTWLTTRRTVFAEQLSFGWWRKGNWRSSQKSWVIFGSHPHTAFPKDSF